MKGKRNHASNLVITLFLLLWYARVVSLINVFFRYCLFMYNSCTLIDSKKKKYFGNCHLYRRLLTFYDEPRVYSLETMERIEQ